MQFARGIRIFHEAWHPYYTVVAGESLTDNYGNTHRSRRIVSRRAGGQELFRPSPRPGHAVLHGDVGAVQLLRDARHPDLLPDDECGAGWAGVRGFEGGRGVRAVRVD